MSNVASREIDMKPIVPDTTVTTIGSPNICTGGFHAYPQSYAGDPQYAEQYFNTCLCGKKRRITTVTEVDVEA